MAVFNNYNPYQNSNVYSQQPMNAVHKIEHMMDNEMNPEKRKAMQDILGMIQMR